MKIVPLLIENVQRCAFVLILLLDKVLVDGLDGDISTTTKMPVHMKHKLLLMCLQAIRLVVFFSAGAIFAQGMPPERIPEPPA